MQIICKTEFAEENFLQKMRKFSAAAQERETTSQSQEKRTIDPKEIPKGSKYSFHDNRFSSEKKVFHTKKMGKKDLKMDQKWEHDKFISANKKPLKVNIIRKEKINQNITVSITKNQPVELASPPSTLSQSSQDQPLTPVSNESTTHAPLASKEPKDKEPVVQVKLQETQEKEELKPRAAVSIPLPPKPKSFKNSKSFNEKDRSVTKNSQEKRESSIPDPLQMVPQIMIPPMYQEPNYIYSPYMTNSGQVLYMTENGLFVPSPVGYYPTYVPVVRSKAIPIIKPSAE
jgi:hypothetical protein